MFKQLFVMKILISAIALIVVLLSVIYLANMSSERGFTEENYIRPISGEPSEPILNLSSDKEVYHSSEKMELNATIETNTVMENVTVKVYGIKDRRGNYRINGEKEITVDPPRTSETFVFQMPSCYGCAGISPGEYEIMMEVLQEGQMIDNSSLRIELEK